MKSLLRGSWMVVAALLWGADAIPQTATHAPDGGSFERLQSISILPRAGAPFSATVVTEWTRLLEDGTTTTMKNHRRVARDSAGRVFQERRFLSPMGDKDATRLSRLQYQDPTRDEFLDCAPETQMCTASFYRMPAEGAMQPAPAGTLPGGQGSLAREDLGRKTIGGLETLGSREIVTVPAGTNGYARPEPTIKEFWYSPRLGVNLVVKRFEPRGGAQSFTVQNIDLSEPDPRLFAPPEGFQVSRQVPR